MFKKKEEQIMRDFQKETAGGALIRSMLRPGNCKTEEEKAFFHLQNKTTYDTLKQDIEVKYEQARLKLSLISLPSAPVRAELTRVKEELLQWNELRYEFFAKGADFPATDLAELFVWEEKYGDQKSQAYFQEIAAEFKKESEEQVRQVKQDLSKIR